MPYEVSFAQQKLYFPSMQIEDEVVWGLTARMLVSLFEGVWIIVKNGLFC